MFRGIVINADQEVVDGSPEKLKQLLQGWEPLGFDAVELSTGCFNIIRNGRVDQRELDEAKQLLTPYPFSWTMHGPCGLSLIREPKQAEKVMKACLQVTAELGAEVFVYHSAQIALHEVHKGLEPLPDDAALATMWEQETEALRTIAPFAESLGVTVVVENRDPHQWEFATIKAAGGNPAEITKYHQGMRLDLLTQQLDAVNSPNVGMCLDVGHAFLAAPYWDVSFEEGVRAAAPFVRHLHLHDNFGRLDDRVDSLADRLIFGEADNHMPPGWGAIPLVQVLKDFYEVDYKGWILAEVRPRYRRYDHRTLQNLRTIIAAATAERM